MMIKMVILFCLTLPAFAGSSSMGIDYSSLSGIITPSIATDGFRTHRVARDPDGNLLVCPQFMWKAAFREVDGKCEDDAGKSAWVRPQNVPPPEKTYVGFRIVSGDYGRVYYEFYWK